MYTSQCCVYNISYIAYGHLLSRPNHKQSFWGAANAARLASIKKRVDPQNFFQVWQGIGWDGAQDAKYECYEELNPGGVQLNG